MIGYEISQEETNITTTVSTSSMVFDLIYEIMNDEAIAIEVSSWSEVASVGNSYETDNFTVKVIWLM
ncbi:hypothetical protein [Sporomusa acidovorans]|uniref:hypothetical protein n=1 Tax=Sporomusa acidovorans TaxID=112900 RepID=UPI00088AFC57|nr:hypothetical protein [Sporomusa acidovorans]OZC19035.1 hypothetical protein SPACI_31210 [Sporomusa acidovorans DSM 3132]SDD73805.1 hypothetical protein SAMN04488499_1003209 [Sporomusa acidovorans]